MKRFTCGCAALLLLSLWMMVQRMPGTTKEGSILDIGSRLELFVDRYLIDKMEGVELRLARPVYAGIALKFEKPWEGAFCAYTTVIKDGSTFRIYYRGLPAGADLLAGSLDEVTCYAESRDGITWSKPDLRLFEANGTRNNNVVLRNEPGSPASHNFTPFLDTRPGVPLSERFKALGGLFLLPPRKGQARNTSGGLLGFVSADGVRWKKLRDTALIGHSHYPVKYNDVSATNAFWSETEGCYVAYVRTWKDDGKPVEEAGFAGNIRWVGRTTSKDFLNWSAVENMSFGDVPVEHLYTNQTHPYFRAPQIYIGLAARFLPGRQVLTEAQARAINVNPSYFKDTSDGVLLSSRGGNLYDRTFMEGFIRPGIGPKDWTSRTNYPALHVVPTGPTEMSFYVQRYYGQPDHELSRYTLRVDGFASVNASYQGGEMTTRPLRFSGKNLVINFATSAPGSIKVEIQDTSGKAISGYSLQEATDMIGNEIERVVSWKGGEDVTRLAGRPVRLRFVMKDADLYALHFQ